MTRYLRLGYLIPRLVLLVVLFCLVEFGSGWALRHAAISGGEQAIGARVEIGETAVSVLDTRASLAEVRVANPQRPMENLFEAERIDLDFEADALLRSKAVVQRGAVRGLRFGTPREESGALDPDDLADAGGDAPAWLSEAAEQAVGEAADQWLAGVEAKLSAQADDLESVRLAEQLADAWPARYDAISAEARAVRDEVARLRRVAEEARSNPLRHAEFLRSVPELIQSLKSRLAGLQTELASLPADLAADKLRIERARVRDEQLIRSRLQLDQLDGDSLTSQLLGDRVTESVRELIGWVRWTRELVPARQPAAAATPRARGVDVHFVGIRRRPDLLIRELEVAGTARLGGGPVELQGVIRDLSTSPELVGQPMHAEFRTTGALPLTVHATVDRTTKTPVDELLVDCPVIAVPPAELGDPSRLSLAMAPSEASLNVSLRIEGEALAGEVQLIQDRVSLTPAVGPSASQIVRRIGPLIRSDLGGVTKPATRVSLSGTLDEPQIAVWSTVGPAVAESLRSAAGKLVRSEAERQLDGASQLIASRTESLDRLLAEASQQLSEEISVPQREIEQLASRWIGQPLGRGTLSFEQLGKRLPATGSLFK